MCKQEQGSLQVTKKKNDKDPFHKKIQSAIAPSKEKRLEEK